MASITVIFVNRGVASQLAEFLVIGFLHVNGYVPYIRLQ